MGPCDLGARSASEAKPESRDHRCWLHSRGRELVRFSFGWLPSIGDQDILVVFPLPVRLFAQ